MASMWFDFFFLSKLLFSIMFFFLNCAIFQIVFFFICATLPNILVKCYGNEKYPIYYC